MNKQVSYKIVSLIFAILVICFAIAFYAFSWTGPTAPPPGDNVDPPINIGGTSQYKSGALGIGGVFRAYSNAIIDGNVGIGIPIPSQKLDVDGYVKGRTGLCIGNDCRTTWPAGGVGFGDWVEVGLNILGGTVYGPAATDGFVTAHAWDGHLQGYTDSGVNPTRMVIRHNLYHSGSGSGIMFPVKKGDYWKVNTQGGDGRIDGLYWIPLGE